MKKNIFFLLLLLFFIIIILAAIYQIFYPHKLSYAVQYMKSGLTTSATKIPAPAKLTGNLSLSQNSVFLSQPFIAPQTKFKLADFSLKNTTNEPINLKKIEVDMAIGTNLYIANNYINNLYLVFGL